MKKIIIYVALSLVALVSKLTAQETFETKVKAISQKIDRITKEEKALLKQEIELVNAQFSKGEINQSQADEQKKKFAQTRADNIENRVAQAQQELKDLIQQKVDGKIAYDTVKKVRELSINWKSKTDSIKKKGEPRTTSQFVFAMGLNNLVTNGDVENSDFRFWGSHFYEWGITHNTRIFKNDNLLHIKYGWSVMYNNLRPTDNRYFVAYNDVTTLETHPTYKLDESRLRSVYLVAPIHLEFDFSGKTIKNNKTIFRTHKSFRFGLGGYAGVRLKTKQILRYEDEYGDCVKQKTKKDFNASNFIYGLSSYIGYKATSLYVKYDLNPLFQDNPVKQNNVSMGVRFDFN